MLNKPIFNEEQHTYKNNQEGYFYTSVTTLVSKYKQPFDNDYWSLYKAGQKILGISEDNKKDYSKLLLKAGLDFNNKTIDNLRSALKIVLGIYYEDVNKEQVVTQQSWKTISKEATDRGTEVHKKKETNLLESGIDLSRYGLTINVVTESLEHIVNLFELKDGVYPELMIWNNKYRIAGISDKVTIDTVGSTRYIDIDDYKTNKKIDTTSYLNTTTGIHTRMLAPVDDLMDCNFIHYSIQLSFYAYFLELFGFVVRNIKFTHIKLNETNEIVEEQPYYVTYLRPQVIRILEHYAARHNR